MAIYVCSHCNKSCDDDLVNSYERGPDPAKHGLVCEPCLEALEASGEGYECPRCELVYVGKPCTYGLDPWGEPDYDDPCCNNCAEKAFEEEMEEIMSGDRVPLWERTNR